jgi:hypothetical protein
VLWRKLVWFIVWCRGVESAELFLHSTYTPSCLGTGAFLPQMKDKRLWRHLAELTLLGWACQLRRFPCRCNVFSSSNSGFSARSCPVSYTPASRRSLFPGQMPCDTTQRIFQGWLTVKWLQGGRSGFDSRRHRTLLPATIVSRPTSRNTQSPIQWEHAADQSLPFCRLSTGIRGALPPPSWPGA